MNPRLQQKLYNKYSKLFIQKDWSPAQTCMCWGIRCNDGWYPLIDNLCSSIVKHTKYNFKGDVQISEIKEKFGGLRFNVDNADDIILGMITFAENMSYNTCEQCSRRGKTRNGSWIKTLCGKCYKKQKNKDGKRK